MPNYTFDKLIDIERRMDRTVTVIARIGNAETVAALQDVSYILAEVRHAAQTFAYNKDDKVRTDAARRLLALFAE